MDELNTKLNKPKQNGENVCVYIYKHYFRLISHIHIHSIHILICILIFYVIYFYNSLCHINLKINKNSNKTINI